MIQVHGDNSSAEAEDGSWAGADSYCRYLAGVRGGCCSKPALRGRVHVQRHSSHCLLSQVARRRLRWTFRLRVRISGYAVSFLPRDAMLSAVYAFVVCVCVSVCLSVTLRFCIKTAKRRITQITPHDSPMTLVFCQRSHGEIRTGSPPNGATNAGEVG